MFFLIVFSLPVITRADGLETFENETAPSATYADGSFTGNNAIVWTYVQSRDATPDSNAYAINGAGLMLRQLSSASKITSESLSGGIHNFSVNLKKGFTGAGNRQVELFINGVSKGTSIAFDDTITHNFAVNDIDVSGNVVIEIRNITAKQVVIDDITWTSLTGGDNPNIVFTSPQNFGELEPGTSATQTLSILNSGTSLVLNVTGISPVSGDTGVFSIPTGFPLAISPNGGSDFIDIIYTPGLITGANHAAVFNILSDDPGDAAKPLTITGTTTPGVLTVSNIQYTTAGSGDSPYLGQTVPVKGVVTYVDSQGYVISDASGGPWSGIYVDEDNHGPDIGDEIRITGVVFEDTSLTEIRDPSDYVLLSVSNPVPAPITVTTTTAKQEQYECVVVCVSNVTVDSEKVAGTYWRVADASSTLEVYHDSQRRLYRYIPKVGNTLDAICGVMWQAGGNYRIQVRDDDDFVGRPVVHYALQGLVMTPDGPRTNWYVEILDDDIVSVGSSAPAVTTYNTGGIIFPGLIDTHNHPAWNSFPTLQFNNVPFGHRDDWGADDPEYDDWKGRRTTVRNHADVLDNTQQTIGKFGEILELMAGCIAIQGMSGSQEYLHPDFGVMNLESFPNRIETDIFPWTMSSSERTAISNAVAGGGLDAVLIHLSEGVDETARAQFDLWYGWGMLTKETTLIHAVPYGTNEVDKIAAVGASVVWSPKSNMKLYNGTANIPLYKSKGINVALAPDWTPSGSYNLLEEMGYAWYINQSQFGGSLTAEEIVDMVTINAAKASGIDHRYGKIAVGYNAGLCVIENPGGDPYMALINARPKSVLLTIIDGTPRFGDATLMSTMGFAGESVNAWGVSKTLNLVTTHPFMTYDTITFASITQGLATAHGTLTTTGELDLEELQYLGLGLLQGGPDDVVPFVADAPLSSPANGSSYTIGDAVSLTYRNQDFWDNDTDTIELRHKQVSVVPASNPDEVLQVIAADRINADTNETINFTMDFNGLHTNYYFRFLIEDLAGSVRTALIDSVGFTVAPAANDQDNDDLLDAWEQQIVDANGGDGIVSVFDVHPEDDFDGDDFTEAQEQHVGTIPTDDTSFFRVDHVVLTPSQGNIALQWPSVGGRTYAVCGDSNLLGSGRSIIAGGIAATAPLNTYTSAVPAEAAYTIYVVVE